MFNKNLLHVIHWKTRDESDFKYFIVSLAGEETNALNHYNKI